MSGNSNRWAMIGSRDLVGIDPRTHSLFARVAFELGKARKPVMTGAAAGADLLAAQEVLRGGGRIELVLPWFGFNDRAVWKLTQRYPGRVITDVYDRSNRHWSDAVMKLHPRAEQLTSSAVLLLARNYGIVEKADAVVGLRYKLGGGTGYTLRLAHHLGVKKIYDLNIFEDEVRLAEEFGWDLLRDFGMKSGLRS